MSKTVKIKEGDLVELIEGVIEKAVESSKKEWLAEQETKANEILEAKVREIASKVIKETK